MCQNGVVDFAKGKLNTTLLYSSIHWAPWSLDWITADQGIIETLKFISFKIVWTSASIVRTEGAAAYLPKLFPSPLGEKELGDNKDEERAKEK
jgi:hypothetical protein